MAASSFSFASATVMPLAWPPAVVELPPPPSASRITCTFTSPREVADVEGASAAHKFFHIKLRYLSPTVLFVTILSIINSFKVFREVYLMSGDYPYDGLYTLQHFMNNTFKSLNYQKLSAAAVMLALVMVVIIALLFRVEDAFGKDVEG